VCSTGSLVDLPVSTVLFLPFAGVSETWDRYAERVRAPFGEMGYDVRSVHRATDPVRAVRNADAIVTGGGNTFHLLANLYSARLLEPIRECVQAGIPYVGWSAGAVVACPTIRTTNDMPIVEPPSLDALGLVPFQINAHFTDFRPPGFQGETRSERLADYLAVNRTVRVVGLPEGTMLRVEPGTVALLGEGSARVFESGRQPRDYAPGNALSFLLR
jgi:dipeptidase E